MRVEILLQGFFNHVKPSILKRKNTNCYNKYVNKLGIFNSNQLQNKLRCQILLD